MKINILFMVGIFTTMVAGFATLLSVMTYMFQSPILLLISQICAFIAFIGAIALTMLAHMCTPIMPYLEAVMKKSMLVIINQVNDNLIMAVPTKKTTTVDVDNYGTFVGNPHSVKTFVGDTEIVIDENVTARSLGGVKTLLVYEENAVPPETDLVKICQRLESVGIHSMQDWKDEVKKGKNPIYVKDLDLKVITRYFEYVNPHYLNVRVERIAAELAREYRQTWEKILPWVSMMIIALLFGAIAFVIINSVLDTGTTTVTNSIPTIIPI